MSQPASRLATAVQRLAIVIGGLRMAATTFAGVALLGALSAMIGLILLGAPWWLALPPAIILALPSIALVRLRSGLGMALSLPDVIRRLPATTFLVPTEMTQLSALVAKLVERPTSLRSFITDLRGARSAFDALSRLRLGPMVDRVLILSPAALMAAGIAALWATFALAVGVLLIIAGILL